MDRLDSKASEVHLVFQVNKVSVELLVDLDQTATVDRQDLQVNQVKEESQVYLDGQDHKATVDHLDNLELPELLDLVVLLDLLD